MDSDICESHAKNKVTDANSHLALAVSCDAQHKVHCSPFPIQFIGNAFSNRAGILEMFLVGLTVWG